MEGKANEYISLQEATKHCNYSQEYLSLRARRGKLKAVKFGRNWVTKRDWLSEYLLGVKEYNDFKNGNNGQNGSEKEKVILKEIVQPPKNLPIEKHFKKITLAPNLKLAISAAMVFILFFGSYVFGMSSFKNVFQDLDPLVTEFNLATESVFTESSLFYKNILKEASPLVTEFNKNFDRGVANINFQFPSPNFQKLAKAINHAVYLTGSAGDILVKETSNSITDSFRITFLQTRETARIFGEYGQWISNEASQFKNNLTEGFVAVNDLLRENFKNGSENFANTSSGLAIFLENRFNAAKDSYISLNDSLERNLKKIPEKLVQGFFNTGSFLKDKADNAKEGYAAANDFLERKLKEASKAITSPFVKAYNYLTLPWREGVSERVFVKEASEKELEALKEEIETLKTKGLTVREIVKEVSKIVQPVREVQTEKIVARVDDVSLALINSQITELQTELAKRLYAPGGVISQQIYVTEPVASPKIYQENGDIVLQTAGTGNVILSAATGMQIAGQQVVIDSLSITNPLIYIADPLTVSGNTTIESKLSVGGELTASTIVSKGSVQTGYDGLQLTATSSAPTESLAAGRIYYDSSASNLQYYDGSSWSAIGTGSGAGGAFATSSDANGNLIYPQDAAYDLVVGTSTGVLATSSAPFWVDSSTGNLTILGDFTSSNVSLASTTNWDALYAAGYVPASLGGTATDTTGWTGFAYIDSGTWATSTPAQTDPLWINSASGDLVYATDTASTTLIGGTATTTISAFEVQGSSTLATTTITDLTIDNLNYSTGTNWDTAYYWYNSSSTNYDNTYDIVNASSSTWDLTEGTVTASSSAWDLASGAITASSSNWDLSYGWYNSSSTAYLQLIGGTITGILNASSTLNASTTVLENTLTVYETSTFSGRVGIGTTAPHSTTTLTVYGDDGGITLDDSVDYHTIRAISEPGLGGRLSIGLDETTRVMVIGDNDDMGNDMGLSAQITPTLYVLNNVATYASVFTSSGWNFNQELATGNSRIRIFESGNNAYFSQELDANMVFRTNAIDRMWLTNTGLLGLATSTPQFGIDLNASSTSGYFGVSNSTSTGDVFIITGDGLLGVATSSPSERLSVQGNLYIEGSASTTGTTSAAGLYVSGEFEYSSTTNWDLAYDYGANYNSSSSNYDTTYDIVNASSTSWDRAYGWGDTWVLSDDLLYATDTASSVVIGGSSTTTNSILEVSSTSTFLGNLSVATDTIEGAMFSVGSTTPSLWVADNGYVGIGTSSPTASLEIVNSSLNELVFSGAQTANIYQSGLGQLMYINTNVGNLYLGTAANTVHIAIDTVGNVGIATSTPTETLTVWGGFSVGTSTEPGLYIASSTGDVGIGTTTVSGAMLNVGTTTSHFWVGDDGYIGIATTSPSYGLEVHASSSTGYFGVSNVLAGDMFLINESGYVGVGTTTPGAFLHIYGANATSALTVQQLDSGNIVDFMSTSTSALTLKSDDYLKYRAGLSQAWGTINDVIIDDFEDNDVSDWVSSDTTNSSSSATSTYFRMGDYAMGLYSASGSSAGDTATTAPSTANWSSYERLSFWLRADYTTTSTDATSTQLISVMLSDGGTTSSSTVTIAEMGKWQYQEWNISGITSTDKDAVDWTGFRIDNDYGSPLFFIDQIRLYDNDLQAGEMFVDGEGNLAIWGQKTVQIGRTSADAGSLPSIEAGTAVVELNQPLSVDTGGDVGFDYDLQFLNTGLSQITSEGPLTISAGDQNHYENLTLTTGGTGDIVMDIASSTLGFKILGSATSSFGNYIFRALPAGQIEIGNELTISGNIFPATDTSATSTQWSLGTSTAAWQSIHVIESYVGDIIFANQFRITEAANDAAPQGLYFQNSSSTNILFIDEEGNLTTRSLAAKKARLEKLEMIDQATGNIWCVWIENGEWVKTSGQCSESLVEEAFVEMVDIVDAVDSTSSTSSISAPDTIIESQPPAQTVSVEAVIEFSSTKENSTFQCKVNNFDWSNCLSPQKYPGLVPGDYTFQVMATDEKGIYDTTPAVVNWTVLTEGSPEPIISEGLPVGTTTESIVLKEPVATAIDSSSTEPIVKTSTTSAETIATSTDSASATATP